MTFKVVKQLNRIGAMDIFMKLTDEWKCFFSQLVHTYPAVLNPSQCAFLYWYEENIKTCCAFVLARCHHGVFYDIVNHPFLKIKLDWHIVPTVRFLLFSFPMMSGTCTQKKTANKIATEGNFRWFSQELSVWAAWRARGLAIIHNENIFRKTSDRRWSECLNPKQSWIGTSVFPFSSKKSR